MATDEPGGIAKILKRDGTVVDYDRDRIATAIFKAAASVGGSDRAASEELAELVEKALIQTYGPGSIPTVEDIQDVVEETLINEGHASTARAYISYRARRADRRGKKASHAEVIDNIPYKKIYDALRWNMEHGCDTIEGINRIIADRLYPDLVQAGEQRYQDDINIGAEHLLDLDHDIRMVIIAGPSSSGKTTTMIKLAEKLGQKGIALKGINIDHYFYDLEMHPMDEFGDYDYESPQALDMALINKHIEALMSGKTIRTPHYDFKTGKRTLNVHEMELAENEILLIDSLHGLHGEMTNSIPDANKFKLYIETLGQVRNSEGVFMRWADNRLMRRMIRDSWHRQLKPMETLTHWHYVRKSELQHIIPCIKSVDYIVNSSMPHELPLHKSKLLGFFTEGMERFRNNPKRQDAYIRAKRVYEFLKDMTGIMEDSAIPPKSLLREFFGGSAYKY